jgi:hypothetical protein
MAMMSDWSIFYDSFFFSFLFFPCSLLRTIPKIDIFPFDWFFLYRLSQELEAEQLRNSVKDREIQQLKYELQVKQNALTPDSGHRTVAAPAAVTPSSESALISTMSSTGPLDYVGDGASGRPPLRNRWADEVRKSFKVSGRAGALTRY